MSTAFARLDDCVYVPPEPPTHIDGPPLCRCGKPCKTYFPRCEDCWLNAQRGSMSRAIDRTPAVLRFRPEAGAV